MTASKAYFRGLVTDAAPTLGVLYISTGNVTKATPALTATSFMATNASGILTTPTRVTNSVLWDDGTTVAASNSPKLTTLTLTSPSLTVSGNTVQVAGTGMTYTLNSNAVTSLDVAVASSTTLYSTQARAWVYDENTSLHTLVVGPNSGNTSLRGTNVRCVVLGGGAGAASTTGAADNTIIGASAAAALATATSCTYIGSSVAASATGSQGTMVGYSAGGKIVGGTGVTCLGSQSGPSIVGGVYDQTLCVYVGYNAGAGTGRTAAKNDNSVIIGANTVTSKCDVGTSVVVGSLASNYASGSTSSVQGCVVVGYNAMSSAGTGISTMLNSSALGYQAGYASGASGTAVSHTRSDFHGYQAGLVTNAVFGQTDTVCVGYQAGSNSAGFGGTRSVAVGSAAGWLSVTNGALIDTICIGYGAIASSTGSGTASALSKAQLQSVAIGNYTGNYAMSNTILLGFQAGLVTKNDQAQGSNDVIAIGTQAGYSNGSGALNGTMSQNVYIGSAAGSIQGGTGVSPGSQTVCIGMKAGAMTSTTTGHSSSVIIGAFAGAAPTGAYTQAVLVGASVNQGVAAGTTNIVAVGYNAGTTFDNSIAIGPLASCTASNQMMVGSTTTTINSVIWKSSGATTPVVLGDSSNPVAMVTAASQAVPTGTLTRTLNAFADQLLFTTAAWALSNAGKITFSAATQTNQCYGMRIGRLVFLNFTGFQNTTNPGNAFFTTAAGTIPTAWLPQTAATSLNATYSARGSVYAGGNQEDGIFNITGAGVLSAWLGTSLTSWNTTNFNSAVNHGVAKCTIMYFTDAASP